MDELRQVLAPLTDWMPPEVRDRVPVEVWWLIFLTVTLAVLLMIGLLLRKLGRALSFRQPVQPAHEREFREDLDECPLPVRPWGDPVLTLYHVPVRMRL